MCLKGGEEEVDKWDMKTLFLFAALLFSVCAPNNASAKAFEIFDGQVYNGLFYPLVDIIEWGEQDNELPHMEFHFHSKDKPMDLSVVSGEKGGKPVLWIMYDLKFRNERICRHVPAPAQFKKNQQLYVYRDPSDPDYDNIFVYSEPLKKKNKTQVDYTMPNYERCTDEQASNMPLEDGAAPPATASSSPAPAAAPEAPRGPASVPTATIPAREGKGIPIDYDNASVPFSF